jgi:hypothetical protein
MMLALTRTPFSSEEEADQHRAGKDPLLAEFGGHVGI